MSPMKIDKAIDALVRKGVKKPEILFRLDLTSASLWNWRTGRVRPHPDNLLKLEALLAEKGLKPGSFK